MKTYPTTTLTGVLHHSDIYRKVIFLFFLLSAALVSFAGGGDNSGPGSHKTLSFRNAKLESGNAGADNAVYRFPQIGNNVDALVKITGRSSSLVKLVSIDINNSGWDNAFQPQVTYNNGNTNGAVDWYMEFEISFVDKDKSSLTTVNSFDVTGLDIDGNGDKIREYVSFYKPKSFLLENSSLLSVKNLLDLLLGLLTPGKKFEGPTTNFTNIDTSATSVMVTNKYENTNKFRVRTGATASGANGAADRMYSLYFKSFQYQVPVEFTLPLVLNAFDASLNNKKVSLNWVTGMEKDLSHFVIERSTNGVDYTEAGLVFAFGNSGVTKKYAFSDVVNTNAKGVIYYRLRMVDTDQRTQLSNVRMIKVGEVNNADIQLTAFPNPVVNEVRVTIPATWQNKSVSYDVYNANGQLVKHTSTRAASQIETVDMKSLGAGIYIVKASTETETAMQRIIKK